MQLLLISTIFHILFLFSPVSTAETKIGQPLLCHGCVAVLKELHKTLKDSSGRKKAVNQSLGRLCQINNFVSYTFSPPKMIKACNYIVENHKEELAENLIEFYRKYKVEDNLPLQEKFCDDVIKACEGIRRPVKDSENPDAFFLPEVNDQALEVIVHNLKEGLNFKFLAAEHNVPHNPDAFFLPEVNDQALEVIVHNLKEGLNFKFLAAEHNVPHMKPHGFSVDEANQKLQNMAEKEISSLESDSNPVLEKPFDATTPVPHEEL